MTESIFQTVRTTFLSDWPALEPDVPFPFDNEEFNPSNDAVDANGKPAPWIWVGIFPTDARAAALGGKETRNEGFVWIICRTQAGTGPDRAWELARKAGSVLKNTTISGITFRAPRFERKGVEENYYRVDALVDYRSEEITT